MATTSGRRWFRFSLRTLLVLVTLMACWIGWESSVVRNRRAMLAELRAHSGYQITSADEWSKRYPEGLPVAPAAKVSLVRAWLGDEAVQEIWYYSYIDNPIAPERLKAVFPEAQLREYLPEPCHPGCFPQGTLVHTPHGRRAIQSIVAGDVVNSIQPDGSLAAATVEYVFVTVNELWKVETEAGALLTTKTQPLCLTTTSTKLAGDLLPGETILHREEDQIREVQVLAVAPTGRNEKVFNLVLGDSKVFVAGDFLARSKPPKLTAAP